MSSDVRIRYSPLPDATPESELEALVACYSFLIQRSENHKAADLNGGIERGGDNDRGSGPPSGSGGPQTPVHQQGVPVTNSSKSREEVKTYHG
jgi:hypothetical protein